MSERNFAELFRMKYYCKFWELNFQNAELVLTEFYSCFWFKEKVKVDWSFACHLGASILSTLMLKK